MDITVKQNPDELNGNMTAEMINLNTIKSDVFGTLVKIGKAIIVTGIANYSVPSNGTIITLPYKPVSEINYRGSHTGENPSSPIRISADGKVISTSLASRTGLNFSISYVTND